MSVFTTPKMPTLVDHNVREFSNAAAYLKFYSKNKESIQDLEIIPPTLGRRGFGRIKVILKPTHGVRKKIKLR